MAGRPAGERGRRVLLAQTVDPQQRVLGTAAQAGCQAHRPPPRGPGRPGPRRGGTRPRCARPRAPPAPAAARAEGSPRGRGRGCSAAGTSSRRSAPTGPAAPADLAQAARPGGVAARHGREQRLGVGVHRVGEQGRRRRALDDPPGVHHATVSQKPATTQVVGDEDHRAAALAASRCRTRRIWAWVVTSSAVVGSSAISSSRLVGDRDRDHHPLAHAAGELVRVLVEPGARRRAIPTSLQQLDGAAARGRPAEAGVVHPQALADLAADRP